MLSCPIWSDLDTTWLAVPPEQVDIAIVLLLSHTQHLFPNQLPHEVLLSALRSRLRLHRESWRDRKKRSRDREAARMDSDQSQDLELIQPNDRAQHEEQLSRQNSPPSLIVTLKTPSSTNQSLETASDQNVDLADRILSSHHLRTAESSALPLFSEHAQGNLVPSNSDASVDSEATLSTTAAADTIIVNLEGRKGTAYVANPTKTSSQKRRQACDIRDEPKVST